MRTIREIRSCKLVLIRPKSQDTVCQKREEEYAGALTAGSKYSSIPAHISRKDVLIWFVDRLSS